MKQCKRGMESLIGIWFSILFCLGVGVSMTIASFIYQGRTLGTLFQAGDMLSLQENKVSFFVVGCLFLAFSIYLIFLFIKTNGEKIEYDETIVAFYIHRHGKRCVPWQLLQEPTVKITWVINKQILIFLFGDGAQLKIPAKYKGFRQLYDALSQRGVPVTQEKAQGQKKHPMNGGPLKQRQHKIMIFAILFAVVSVSSFAFGAIVKYSPKGEPVPFDSKNPKETYSYLDVYSAQPLAQTTAYSPPNKYFYAAYTSNGSLCIFSLDTPRPALTRGRAGGVPYGEPIVRLQGYTSPHHRMLKSMLMQDMNLSEQEFYEMFGNRYLTERQEIGGYDWCMVAGFLFTLFSLFCFYVLWRSPRIRDAS